MTSSKLLNRFQWAKSPLIINAPMSGAVTPRLAIEVTKAGGFGFLGATVDINPGSQHLKVLEDSLIEARASFPDLAADSPVPIGAAFLTGHSSVTEFASTALPILAEHRPSAVWLFAPDGDLKPHPAIIRLVRALDPAPLVFVQVGNVAAVREEVAHGADVIVAQGTDAGGHQFRRGSSIVPLVPEVRNLLEEEFPGRDVSVVAAGGIVDGRGVAAALALGAEGAVLGTRFTVATESAYADFRKQLVLNTDDGGVSTLKSPFNDQIAKSTLWGPLYDGRAIISPIHEQFLAGGSLDDCLQKLESDYTKEEATKLINTWAGAGVGLVKKAQPAGEIVREVQESTRVIIKKLSGLV